MRKVCKVTEEQLPKEYLRVLNGLLGLTDGEIVLTSKIISRYRKYGGDGLREPYLSKFVFSTEERKSLCSEMGGLSNQNLGNKLKQLVDKQVLVSSEGSYVLHQSLLPQPEVTFIFKLVDGQPTEDVQRSGGKPGDK